MQLLFGQHVNDTKACNGTSVGIVLCFGNYSGMKMLKPKFDIKSVKTIRLQMILSNLKKLAFLLNNKLRAIAVPILFR